MFFTNSKDKKEEVQRYKQWINVFQSLCTADKLMGSKENIKQYNLNNDLIVSIDSSKAQVIISDLNRITFLTLSIDNKGNDGNLIMKLESGNYNCLEEIINPSNSNIEKRLEEKKATTDDENMVVAYENSIHLFNHVKEVVDQNEKQLEIVKKIKPVLDLMPYLTPEDLESTMNTIGLNNIKNPDNFRKYMINARERKVEELNKMGVRSATGKVTPVDFDYSGILDEINQHLEVLGDGLRYMNYDFYSDYINGYISENEAKYKIENKENNMSSISGLQVDEPVAGPIPGTMPEPQQESAAGPIPGPMPGPQPGSVAGPISGPMPGPQQGQVASQIPGPMLGPQSGPVAGPIPGPMPGPQPGPVAGPIPGPMPGPQPEPVVEPMNEPVPEPQPEPVVEPMAEPVPEPQPEPVVEPMVEPVPEPQPEPVVEPMAEPVPEPQPEPVVEPMVEPVPEPQPEPVVEPIAEPVPEPQPEPVVESMTEPVVEPIPEPVSEPQPEEVVNDDTKLKTTKNVKSESKSVQKQKSKTKNKKNISKDKQDINDINFDQPLEDLIENLQDFSDDELEENLKEVRERNINRQQLLKRAKLIAKVKEAQLESKRIDDMFKEAQDSINEDKD